MFIYFLWKPFIFIYKTAFLILKDIVQTNVIFYCAPKFNSLWKQQFMRGPTNKMYCVKFKAFVTKKIKREGGTVLRARSILVNRESNTMVVVRFSQSDGTSTMVQPAYSLGCLCWKIRIWWLIARKWLSNWHCGSGPQMCVQLCT